MSKSVIEVQNVSKQYQIGATKDRYLSLRDEIAKRINFSNRRSTSVSTDFWALRDITFAVNHGEVVGIIGRNGAGKSTLLKVLSQITPPTTGKCIFRGRVASLLEVGTGFHPELTGRENIYLNGAIMGMTKREIKHKFDEIVEFSEVEKFLDTPVKRYSSGMYVRLAFGVAAHLEPEILIIDEVLAVGDAQFQKKCLGKMSDVAKSGRTVLFVSHNMAAVRQLCSSGIMLDKGRLVINGSVSECIDAYLDKRGQDLSPITAHITKNSTIVNLNSVLVNGSSTDQLELPANTRGVSIEITGTLMRPLRLEIEVNLLDQQDVPLAFFSPGHENAETAVLPAGPFRLLRNMELPRLMKGQYYLSLYITDPGRTGWIDMPHAVQISAEGTSTATGSVFDNNSGRGWQMLSELPTLSPMNRCKSDSNELSRNNAL